MPSRRYHEKYSRCALCAARDLTPPRRCGPTDRTDEQRVIADIDARGLDSLRDVATEQHRASPPRSAPAEPEREQVRRHVEPRRKGFVQDCGTMSDELIQWGWTRRA